jgi:hypothetical protein
MSSKQSAFGLLYIPLGLLFIVFFVFALFAWGMLPA